MKYIILSICPKHETKQNPSWNKNLATIVDTITLNIFGKIIDNLTFASG